MAIAIGTMLLLVGTACLVIGIVRARSALESEHWRRVPGRIVTSEVTALGVGADRTHHLELSYSYDVDGSTRQSSRIRYRPLWRADHPERFARIVQRYPRGAGVTVYVHPSDPSRAVLEPGGGWTMLMLPAAGLLLVVTGGIVVL